MFDFIQGSFAPNVATRSVRDHLKILAEQKIDRSNLQTEPLAAGKHVDFRLKCLDFRLKWWGRCTEHVRFCIELFGFCSSSIPCLQTPTSVQQSSAARSVFITFSRSAALVQVLGSTCTMRTISCRCRGGRRGLWLRRGQTRGRGMLCMAVIYTSSAQRQTCRRSDARHWRAQSTRVRLYTSRECGITRHATSMR